ncbi:DUF2332 domain-containing protein [Paracoccus tegillarcae]|uniref:DUF2332 domain-containing protein n=1 Tax=Paracoccus tegillarcae TaxID=1529068 RepID=A0A2K9F2N0_9RHOB|nr:DUF2332 domain-containing protein [Paracoccus tegillarcae]AUH34612.1 DUF2332 domain-containing protein [Paracoccus tegillarcae]
MTPRAAFVDQARSCRALGSELTARVIEQLGQALQPEQGEVARRVLDWPGDASSRGDSVPLRLAGALHALVLAQQDEPLALAYADGDPSADLLLGVIERHSDHIMRWLDSPPQTNEVGRAAVLIAAARFLAGLTPLPLELLELGASAGLNLNFHRYVLRPDQGTDAEVARADKSAVILRPKWRGDLPAAQFQVAAGAGVDLRPVDLAANADRLLAYCWPDQGERMQRLRAALKLAEKYPPQVAAADAAGWLQAQLARPAPGHCRMVYHTVAWQYFPTKTQAACEAALQLAGSQADRDAPLAHVSMEADGGSGAALRLRLWDGQMREWALGRADFHGRWADWAPVSL